MSSGTVQIAHCTPDDVFATLADGWLYPVWVVGAARMRDVSPTWPEEGSKIHHSLGIWPVLVNDETEIVEWTPSRRMRLRAKAGPLGRGVVLIEVRPYADGCLIRMSEEPVTGVVRYMPDFLWAPLLRARNRETLRRLAAIAEGRRRERASGEPSARDDAPTDTHGVASAEAREDVREAAQDASA